MRLCHSLAATSLAACLLLPMRLWAQQAAEVTRGRVTGDSSRAMVAATVMVTRGPDRMTLSDTTDSNGNYSVRFQEGTGDYLVDVSATGFRASRRRVQRQAQEREFVADFTLARDIAILAAQIVMADRAVRANNTVRPNEPEPESAQKWLDGINGSISPSIAGDLNAIVGTMSNVTMTGTGPSIMGSGQVAALKRADSVFSAQVRALYIPLGEFIARGQGGAGMAELDSVQSIQKEYWKVFWVQPEIADSLLTTSQKALFPMFVRMAGIPRRDRERSQWQFGHPVTYSDKPKDPLK